MVVQVSDYRLLSYYFRAANNLDILNAPVYSLIAVRRTPKRPWSSFEVYLVRYALSLPQPTIPNLLMRAEYAYDAVVMFSVGGY